MPLFILWVSYKQYISILCLCSHTYVYVLENAAFLARETCSYFGWPVKEYYKEMQRPSVKERGFITVSLQKLCHILFIPNIPVNKHCLMHFIWLSQFLITIRFAEDKGHCEHQQQTMPVNIFPAS